MYRDMTNCLKTDGANVYLPTLYVGHLIRVVCMYVGGVSRSFGECLKINFCSRVWRDIVRHFAKTECLLIWGGGAGGYLNTPVLANCLTIGR
jgi:hypothetical protein